MRLRIREYKNGVRVGSRLYSATQSLTSDWKKISMEYVSRASGSSFDFQVLNIGHIAGDVFLIDDVAIRRLDTGTSIAMNIQSPTPASVLTAGGNCLLQSATAIETPGNRSVIWTGTDERNARVGAGIYLIRISDGETVKVQRAVRLR